LSSQQIMRSFGSAMGISTINHVKPKPRPCTCGRP
jgi:hypothetical protein